MKRFIKLFLLLCSWALVAIVSAASIIVLFMNLAFLIGFVAAKKRKDRNR